MSQGLNLKIANFMLREPVCVTNRTAIRDVSIRLQRTGKNIAIVTDDFGYPQGIVTTGDLLAACICECVCDLHPMQMPIETLMNQAIGLIEENDRLSDLRAILLTGSKYATVVTHENGTVCGLLTADEYANAVTYLLENDHDHDKDMVTFFYGKDSRKLRSSLVKEVA